MPTTSPKIFFFVVLFICSCGRKCPCAPAEMAIELVSFSKVDADTVIIRRFEKAGNYQSLIDTAIVDSTNCDYVDRGGDTVELATSVPIGHLLSGYDYEIFIPSINKISRIRQLTEQQEEGPCGRCVDFIDTYNEDGVKVTSHQLFISR